MEAQRERCGDNHRQTSFSKCRVMESQAHTDTQKYVNDYEIKKKK